jgi:hypothetical protein
MVSAGNFSRKKPTDAAMAFTWPGVPVIAWASIRPCRSKTPADKSPASRTVLENAVRMRVWACSSTTARRRFHISWLWICARGELAFMLQRPAVRG